MGSRSATKPVTLQDVAKSTGLSSSTVSRALRNDRLVNEETRKLVHEVARNLGYRYERLRSGVPARGLKHVRFIVSSSLQNGQVQVGHEPVLTGLMRFTEEGKGEIVVVGDDLAMTRSELQQCTGAVFIMPNKTSPALRKCLDAGVPVAVVSRYFENVNLCVRPDNEEICRLAFEHLTALGHSRIAFAGQDQTNLAMQERSRIVERLCTESGCSASIVWFSGTKRDDLRMVQELWQSGKWPTGWICGSDYVAIDLLRICQEASIAVPDDVSIVGIGNFDWCEIVQPALTSVAVPHEEMGYWAGKLLSVCASHVEGRHDLVLRSSLAVRNSTGPAKARG